jgi:exonuclease SbcC
LTLENFMPYRGRQPPLDLGGLGIACLAGDNGAGKSAILDGITWCLWGRSRAGASADSLVSAGESEVVVELEFRLGEGLYRVLRRHRLPRSNSGAGQSALELQAWDGDQFRAQSGARSRETQEQITGLLRLDYDTFVNTAFLVQGKADLFTRMRPAERRRMLGEVLGLTHYDRFADRAREQAREREMDRRSHEGLTASFEKGLDREPDVLRDLESATHDLDTRREELTNATREAEALREGVAKQREGRKELEQLSAEGVRRTGELDRLRMELGEWVSRVANARAFVDRGTEIEEGYSTLQAARASLAGHGEKARTVNELNARKPAFEQAITRERTVLERELASRQAQARELVRRVESKDSLGRRLAEVEQRRQGHEVSRSELAKKSEEREALGRELESKRAVLARLQDERQLIAESLAIFDSRDRADVSAEVCPVCGAELGTHGLDEVRRHYAERRSKNDLETADLTDEGRLLRTKHDALQRWSQEAAAEVERAAASIESEIGAIEADMRSADTAAEELSPVQADIEALTSRFASSQFAESERAGLVALESEITAVGYDPEAHRVGESLATGLERWDGEHRALEEARTSLSNQTARVDELTLRRDDTKGMLAEVTARAASVQQELSETADIESRLTTLESTIDSVRRAISELERNRGSLERDRAHLEQQRSSLRSARRDERRSADEMSIYDDLATAFGVQGIQALLVETAIPEIEEEANRLLSALTGNRMSLRLDTQRETRGGGQQEVLDVMIGDEWGTRKYEMFSGGEAFRIDFALRVALSQVLARRSGAEVPLLFIDEGFGTQDTTGRQRLVEAVSTLWNDPSFHDGLILVITHIDEIKNQFDSRIEVTKTDHGSRFEVIS